MFPLTASRRRSFRALAAGFVPETALATPAQWTTLETTVAGALAARPPALARQIAALILLLELLARVRYGRGLARLDARRRTALLETLAAAPLLLLRRGIWGLRTLVMLGWYTQDEVVAGLGYRARAEGWDATR